jgi:hypothetical protein
MPPAAFIDLLDFDLLLFPEFYLRRQERVDLGRMLSFHE